MLDSETRRRIDTARDILVGKVPDPKSQVEQITIALVYKFMDDMDMQSVEIGGKRSFFKGKFEKYSWRDIFDPRLGGSEMLALYGEAITNMSQNENLPQLFRDIFKNAFLPYRDPETLKLFLKTINEFTYDHSEKLGDAFEYLLSVLGSQGDAGQFRTPRHIIDFMVQVIAPQKHETVLDPACGTAGFLVSAYKYILNHPSPRPSPIGRGSGLSVQEKQRLYENFTGYDISPDMVRLSLVNLYLHGFIKPQIHEYDTLTSEDRWNEYADVILANPPFMSPKGGIQPHKRFSVQSSRSEVLFVDYMAEHLTPNGRAAIIVPEGIIFQSGSAYKQLRKFLIEQNYLWAVVSLPAGVFNPYAGVKTSILFLDRGLAKKTDQVLFVKVGADGFDLGAQRRPIDRNDLPEALRILNTWKHKVASGTEQSTFPDVVARRSPEGATTKQSPVSEGVASPSFDYAATNSGSAQDGSQRHGSKDMSLRAHVAKQSPFQDVVARSSAGGAATKQSPENEGVALRNEEIASLQDASQSSGRAPSSQRHGGNDMYLLVPTSRLADASGGDYNLSADRYREVTRVGKQTYPMVALGDYYEEIKSGFAYGKSQKDSGDIPHLRPMNIDTNGQLVLDDVKYVPLDSEGRYDEYFIRKGDVLFNNTNSKELVGKTCFVNKDLQALFSNHITRIRTKPELEPAYLAHVLHSLWRRNYFLSLSNKWVGQAGINTTMLKEIQIPLPPLEIQRQIVDEIAAYQHEIEKKKQEIVELEKKIQNRINQVWEE